MNVVGHRRARIAGDMSYPAPWASTIFEAACADGDELGGVAFGTARG